MNSFGESNGQAIGKPLTVLRISESELRKSFENLQEPVVFGDTVAGEGNFMVDCRSCPSVHRMEAVAQPIANLSRCKEDFEKGDSRKNADYNAYGRKITAACQQGKEGSIPLVIDLRSDEDVVETATQACLEEGKTIGPSDVSHEEQAVSPFSSDDSNEVFPSKPVEEKARPAIHRGNFSKLRRPFKSDSSLSSADESGVPRKALLSDSSVANYIEESAVVNACIKSTEEVTPKDTGHPPCDLEDGTCFNEEATRLDNNDSTRIVEEDDSLAKGFSDHWTEAESSLIVSSSDKKLGVTVSATENWREKPSVDLGEPRSQSSTTCTSSENWRERKSASLTGFWRSRSHDENWRDKKSLSVDEAVQNMKSALTSKEPKRYSHGDIKLERQDSNNKGNRSPGGGFGLPIQASQELEGTLSDEQHKSSKSELVEVQLTEDESLGLRWWRLAEIQSDTGCKLFHDKEKHTVVIKGDPLPCKAAKNRVYSAVAALQEEFGALVPLSTEILEHLKTEGRTLLAERLALCSAANVKMINDAQLFISGHRTCVNLAKQQLAKIKVMLKYTDDPDVTSLSQQDDEEEDIQRVQRIFAALAERPRQFNEIDNTNEKEDTPSEGSLSREFLLSLASNPFSWQRPSDLSLERTDDWVTDIVLVNGRRGEQILQGTKKGFGIPSLDSRTKLPSVETC